MKIEHAVYQSAKMFGRHFDDKDELYSHITRQSIDVLKASACPPAAMRLRIADVCGRFAVFIQGGCHDGGMASDQGAEACAWPCCDRSCYRSL